jgi:hypothetical protein
VLGGKLRIKTFFGFFPQLFKKTPPWGFEHLSFKHLEHGAILSSSWFIGMEQKATNLHANLFSYDC